MRIMTYFPVMGIVLEYHITKLYRSMIYLKKISKKNALGLIESRVKKQI
jgi:hypothetical protein